MNFMQAVSAVKQEGKVSSVALGISLMFNDGILIDAASEEELIVTQEILDATDYVVTTASIADLEEDEAYLVFDVEKARWVSTTNPKKHLDAGKRVAVFSLVDEL